MRRGLYFSERLAAFAAKGRIALRRRGSVNAAVAVLAELARARHVMLAEVDVSVFVDVRFLDRKSVV